MYGSNDHCAPEGLCSHSETVNNDHDGEEVCTLCGLVLEPIYDSSSSICAEDIGNNKSEPFYFIENICKNNNLPESLIDYTYQCYKTFVSQINIRKYGMEAVASYALYEALKRFEIPRTSDEIQHMTAVNRKMLWKLERELYNSSTFVHPSKYVMRYCSYLNLSYFHSKRIETIVSHMVGYTDIKPNVLVATCIFLYCKQSDMYVTLKRVAEICGVSTSNITKVVKRMPNQYVDHISVWCE